MMARGRAASIRCANDCAAKPPKTAAWMAPRRVIASAAMSAAGIIGTMGRVGVVSGGFGWYLVIWICHWLCPLPLGEARGGPAVAELS
jgi:hypothetical protein